MRLPARSVLLFVISALCCAPLQAAPPWKRAYRAERELIRATEQANAKYARAAAQYQKKIQKQEEKYLRQAYRAGIPPLSCYAPPNPAPTYYVIQQPGQRRVVISSPATYTGPTPVRALTSRTMPRRIGPPIVSSAPVIVRPGRPTQVTQQQPAKRLPQTPVVDSPADPPRGRASSATVVDQLVIETEPVPELVPTPMPATPSTAVVPASASEGPQPTPAKRPQ